MPHWYFLIPDRHSKFVFGIKPNNWQLFNNEKDTVLNPINEIKETATCSMKKDKGKSPNNNKKEIGKISKLYSNK